MRHIVILALAPLIALVLTVAATIGGADQPVSAAALSPVNQSLSEAPDSQVSTCGAYIYGRSRHSWNAQYNSLGELLGWNVKVWQTFFVYDANRKLCRTQTHLVRTYWVPYVGS